MQEKNTTKGKVVSYYELNKDAIKKRRMERYYETRVLKGRHAWNKGMEMSIEYRVKLSKAHNPSGKTNCRGYKNFLGMEEHRALMMLSLGRKLLSSEIVHHIDHNKVNNDLNNLILLPNRHCHEMVHKYKFKSRSEIEMFIKAYESGELKIQEN